MICRLWHGWTVPENADAYESLIRETIFPGIRARNIPGLEQMELLRSEPMADAATGEIEVTFITLMYFSGWDAVTRFAGPAQPTGAVVPPAARAVLKRFDRTSAHFEIKVQNWGRKPGRRQGMPLVASV
ncbi:antibiotic biosynthesis monooxygenase [Radicibacter daui]|uniref:antibiotic biosynthesis monooxygenase n=1 Tax=Radicibacter daui TaxID=3064829 RepID=UPI004046EBE8